MREEYDSEEREAIQIMTLISIGLITILNLGMMIYGKILANRAKKHQA